MLAFIIIFQQRTKRYRRLRNYACLQALVNITGACHMKKFGELCHCNTYIAAVTNYVNKCIDLVAKSTELCLKMLVTINPSLLLNFPC